MVCADVRLPRAERVVDEDVRESRQLCCEPSARGVGVGGGESFLSFEPPRVGEVDAADSPMFEIFDEPVDAGVDVEDTAAGLDAKRGHREHHPELVLEVPDDRRDGVFVAARQLTRLFIVRAVDVGHEDGTSSPLDDVVEGRDGLVDPEGVVDDAVLDAVVVHADEHDLVLEVRVLHATQAGAHRAYSRRTPTYKFLRLGLSRRAAEGGCTVGFGRESRRRWSVGRRSPSELAYRTCASTSGCAEE